MSTALYEHALRAIGVMGRWRLGVMLLISLSCAVSLPDEDHWYKVVSALPEEMDCGKVCSACRTDAQDFLQMTSRHLKPKQLQRPMGSEEKPAAQETLSTETSVSGSPLSLLEEDVRESSTEKEKEKESIMDKDIAGKKSSRRLLGSGRRRCCNAEQTQKGGERTAKRGAGFRERQNKQNNGERRGKTNESQGKIRTNEANRKRGIAAATKASISNAIKASNAVNKKYDNCALAVANTRYGILVRAPPPPPPPPPAAGEPGAITLSGPYDRPQKLIQGVNNMRPQVSISLMIHTTGDLSGDPILLGGTGKCGNLVVIVRGPTVGFGVQCNGGGSDPILKANIGATAGQSFNLQFTYSALTKKARIYLDGQLVAHAKKAFNFPGEGEISVMRGSHDVNEEVFKGVVKDIVISPHINVRQAHGEISLPGPYDKPQLLHRAAENLRPRVSVIMVATTGKSLFRQGLFMFGGDGECGNLYAIILGHNVAFGVQCNQGGSDPPLVANIGARSNREYKLQFIYDAVTMQAKIYLMGKAMAISTKAWNFPSKGKISVNRCSHINNNEMMVNGGSVRDIIISTSLKVKQRFDWILGSPAGAADKNIEHVRKGPLLVAPTPAPRGMTNTGPKFKAHVLNKQPMFLRNGYCNWHYVAVAAGNVEQCAAACRRTPGCQIFSYPQFGCRVSKCGADPGPGPCPANHQCPVAGGAGTVYRIAGSSATATQSLQHANQDCWGPCHGRQGPCGWCGGGVCCRRDWGDRSNGCRPGIGSWHHHGCVSNSAGTELVQLESKTVASADEDTNLLEDAWEEDSAPGVTNKASPKMLQIS